MNDQERAKAAVECLPAMKQYLEGHDPADLNVQLPMHFNHRTWTAIIETLESHRPVAEGKSVIAPIEPTDKMMNHFSGYSFSQLEKSKRENELRAYRAMLAAKEGE
jgi:hypothetical protein